MADQDWNGLPYGHFGNPRYQADEQSWRFEKIPRQPRAFEQLGDPKIVAPSPGLPIFTRATESTSQPPAIRHGKQVDEFLRSNPMFQPATPLLAPLLRTSAAVVTASARHDPIRGSLLSFGRIFDERTRRPTQVAAYATGPTGSDVRLVQVQLQKQGWDDSRDVWLEVPVVAGEETTWQNDGAPVMQVCFAQPLERGENLLAVRTSCRTLIFKPVLKYSGPARLQLRLLFELGADEWGGEIHADVAFNPWFPRQFAVITQSGRWKVWEFSNRESSDATCIRSSVDEEVDTRSTALNDGWARISWICNPSTLLVATRGAVSLYDISSHTLELQDLKLNVSDVSAWVLDLAAVPSDPTRALVLTTTHIHLVLVDERSGYPQAQSAMRIRHFQSAENTSLRLTLFRNEEVLTTIIRSALNSTLVAYLFDLEESHNATLHDPVRFQLRSTSDGNSDSAQALEFHLQSISVAEKRSANVDNTLAGRLRAGDCRFISLMALTKDLTVSSLLYLDRPTEYHTHEALALTWSGKVTGTTSKLENNFVTDEEPFPSEIFEQMSEPVAAYIRQRRDHAKRVSGPERTLQHEYTARKIDSMSSLASDVMVTFAETRDLIKQPVEADIAVMKTVLDLSDGEVTINDMDLASAQLEQLASTAMSPPLQSLDPTDAATRSMKFALIPTPTFVQVDGNHALSSANTLTIAYDSIVSHWISPLSTCVPGRVRLAKEQLARRLAADITLASHVLRPEEIEDPAEGQQDGKSVTQNHSWDLPMRGAEVSQASQFSQSVLPTPSPTGTPSVTTASSRTSAFSSAEVSRLRKYATFTKPAPSSLPRSLNRILSHWTPGADPSIYDWITTSRQITQQTQEEEADSQLTEKQRARLHRKAERHIRRQRKEAEASQQQHLASSQMPELVVSASQPQALVADGRSESQRVARPGAGFGGIMPSSQSFAQGAASQAVAGRFGGGAARPPAKKKRKQGF